MYIYICHIHLYCRQAHTRNTAWHSLSTVGNVCVHDISSEEMHSNRVKQYPWNQNWAFWKWCIQLCTCVFCTPKWLFYCEKWWSTNGMEYPKEIVMENDNDSAHQWMYTRNIPQLIDQTRIFIAHFTHGFHGVPSEPPLPIHQSSKFRPSRGFGRSAGTSTAVGILVGDPPPRILPAGRKKGFEDQLLEGFLPLILQEKMVQMDIKQYLKAGYMMYMPLGPGQFNLLTDPNFIAWRNFTRSQTWFYKIHWTLRSTNHFGTGTTPGTPWRARDATGHRGWANAYPWPSRRKDSDQLL